MDNYWYRIKSGIPDEHQVRSYDFGIVVLEEYVEAVRGFSTPQFIETFERNVEDFAKNNGLRDLRAILKEGDPVWLRGIDFGSGNCALYHDTGGVVMPDVDRRRERLFWTHNCDSLAQRGGIISVFSIWANLIDVLHWEKEEKVRTQKPKSR